jgi:hypothetical protein
MCGTGVRRTDQRGVIPGPRVFAEAQSFADAFAAVEKELIRVFERFGEQSLTLFDWVSILGEEYGELCRAINDYEFGSEARADLIDVYREAVQVAAVAVHIASVIRPSS